jgi:hypothetical protein
MSNFTFDRQYGGVCGRCDRDIEIHLPSRGPKSNPSNAWVECAECGNRTPIEKNTKPDSIRARRQGEANKTVMEFDA